MTTFGRSDDLEGARFREVSLAGAWFQECDLSGVVMRGVEVARMDIDAPWLEYGDYFRVNGVDVTRYVEEELDRLFPGRSQRRPSDPESLRSALAALEAAWEPAMARAAALPPGGVDERVAGEWSFSQTLRHLVHATDLWFTRPVLGATDPFHPLGLGHDQDAEAAPYDEVLAARESRVASVREYAATVTPEVLAEPRANPHAPDRPETVLTMLHTILEEGWEHLRFAVRDLEVVEEGGARSAQDA